MYVTRRYILLRKECFEIKAVPSDGASSIEYAYAQGQKGTQSETPGIKSRFLGFYDTKLRSFDHRSNKQTLRLSRSGHGERGEECFGCMETSSKHVQMV
jgi:hypothetical protein